MLICALVSKYTDLGRELLGQLHICRFEALLSCCSLPSKAPARCRMSFWLAIFGEETYNNESIHCKEFQRFLSETTETSRPTQVIRYDSVDCKKKNILLHVTAHYSSSAGNQDLDHCQVSIYNGFFLHTVHILNTEN